jgi:hypothetical protein
MLLPRWQASFHVEQSVTDPESAIVTIKQLRPGAKPRKGKP